VTTVTDADARFGEIIQWSEGKTKIDPTYQVFIPAPAEILDLGSWLGWRGYIVSQPLQDHGIATGTLSIPIEAPEEDWRLTLELQYDASVTRETRDLEGTARLVVSTLGKHRKPRIEFESRLEAMFRKFVRDQGGPARVMPRLSELRSRVRDEIKKRMAMELGLDVTIPKLTWRTPEGFVNRDPIARTVKFHAVDFPNEREIEVQLELEAADWLSLVHHPRYPALIDRAINTIRTKLLATTLHVLTTDLGGVTRDLRPLLDDILKKEGRKVARFALSHVGEWPPVPQPPTVSVRIGPFQEPFIKGVDYPRAVTVDCEIHVTQKDVGAYILAGKPDLTAWARTACRIAIEEKLLNVSYINLFLGQEPGGETGFVRFDRRIALAKDVIRAAAARIGYEVDWINIRTDLGFEELRRGFKIDVKGEKFALNDPAFEAELDVFVTTRIKEDAIRDLFQRTPDIKGLVESEVREIVRSFMRETDPDNYYFFFMPEEYRAAGGQGLLQRLEERIEERLVELYQVDEFGVAFERHLTPQEERFKEISQSDREMEIAIERSELGFTMRYRVQLVSRPQWRQFRERMPTIDQVHGLVTSCLQEWMNDQTRDKLINSLNSEIKKALNDPEYGAFVPIVYELGLWVQVVTLNRKQAGEDDTRLKTLRAGRIKAIEQHDYDRRERIAALDRQIGYLRTNADRAQERGDADEASELHGRAEELAEEREKLRQESIYMSALVPLARDAAASAGRDPDEGKTTSDGWRIGPSQGEGRAALPGSKKRASGQIDKGSR
jgi:hypothetical protein